MTEYAYHQNLPLLVLLALSSCAVLWQIRGMIHKHFSDGAHVITYIARHAHVTVNISSEVMHQFKKVEVHDAIRKTLSWKHLELTDDAVKQLEWWFEWKVEENAHHNQGCLCMLRDPERYHTGYALEIRVRRGELAVDYIEVQHPTKVISNGCSEEYAAFGMWRTLSSLLTGKGPWSPYLDEVWGLNHRIYPILTPAMKRYHLVNTLGTIFFSTIALAIVLVWLHNDVYWPLGVFAIWLVSIARFSGANLLTTLADLVDDSPVYSFYRDTELLLAAEESSRKTTQRFVVMSVSFLALIITIVVTAFAPTSAAGFVGISLTTLVLGGAGGGFVGNFKKFLEATVRLDRLHFARQLNIKDCNHVI